MCKIWFEGEFNLKSTKIKVLKANFILLFTFNFEDNVVGASKSFYSDKKLDPLFDILDKKFVESINPDAIRMKVTLVDKETNNSKTKYYMIDLIGNIRDLIEGMKTEIMGMKCVVEIKTENKYRVNISNCSSVKSDKKGFSIICKDTIDEVVDGLKKLLNAIIEQEEDANVVFSDNKKITSTHRIMVQKSGCKEDYKLTTKWFSINLPNFSSYEIVNLLVDKINGVKK